MIGKIAVSAAIYSIDKPYDYLLPTGWEAVPGMRVLVPFGKGNKPCEGVILSVEEGDGAGLKTALELLDPQPLLDEKALHLAAFLRERYFCTFYDGVKTILPAGVWFQERERYEIARGDWRGEIHRNATAVSVMELLEALGGKAEKEQLRTNFETEALEKALQYLLRKKLLSCQTQRRRSVGDKTERIVLLAASAEEALAYAARKKKTAPVQAEILEMMASVGECSAKELCYFTGANQSTLNRLETLGFLTFTQEERLRIDHVLPAKLEGPLCLNGEQQQAYEGLRKQFDGTRPGVALLHGVTGSGKTSVYIRLIYDCLARGKSAVLLVPEIALTPQLLALFAAHFSDQVAVLHSSLRVTQRYDTWKRIRRGEARVVLGTRSAVFAPVKDPGLFILDEEQEHTYKSENNPRYHAREVAIYRGMQENAGVLLGSATPSVATMYRAKTGAYGYFSLKQRFNRMALPRVQIVDMKQELREGNGTAISQPLRVALQETMDLGQQAILFLNRRGSSRMLACVDCGYVPACPGCTVNLVYHQTNCRLMCHYCGHSQPMPGRCPECGGHLKQIGYGTQKVQQQLESCFPGVEILRMDADTVSPTNTHERLLNRFRDEKIPILLGTQMVTKGLNFDNVTLVGVLDADLSLYVGSYRAAETTFSMVTQVIGRAGRGTQAGRALIQTMTPENPVIRLAAEQDYDAFYAQELPLRELRQCPPFQDLICLTFHGREEEGVWQSALAFRDALAASLSSPHYCHEEVSLLGPAPAQIAKINYNYRCRLMVSCRNTRNLRQLLSYKMREFMKNRQNRGIGLYADANSNE